MVTRNPKDYYLWNKKGNDGVEPSTSRYTGLCSRRFRGGDHGRTLISSSDVRYSIIPDREAPYPCGEVHCISQYIVILHHKHIHAIGMYVLYSLTNCQGCWLLASQKRFIAFFRNLLLGGHSLYSDRNDHHLRDGSCAPHTLHMHICSAITALAAFDRYSRSGDFNPNLMLDA